MTLMMRHEFQPESCRPVFGSVTSDFTSMGYPLPRSVTPPPVCTSYLPSLCRYGPCQVDTGTLISPFIHLLSPLSVLSNPSSHQRRAEIRTLTVEHSTRKMLPYAWKNKRRPKLTAPSAKHSCRQENSPRSTFCPALRRMPHCHQC
ncbi:uncharacterized protein LOC144073704 [Stigmatopora argus]